VQKGVTDPCSRRESHAVARLKRVQYAVDPGIGSAFDDENEFLFRTLGMRVADAPPRRHAHVMDSNARQSEFLAKRCVEAHLLVIAAILTGVGVFQGRPMSNEVGARHESPDRFTRSIMTGMWA